jgi:hypothetical protein
MSSGDAEKRNGPREGAVEPLDKPTAGYVAMIAGLRARDVLGDLIIAPPPHRGEPPWQ